MDPSTSVIPHRIDQVPLFPDRCLEKSDISSFDMGSIFTIFANIPPKPSPLELPTFAFVATLMGAMLAYKIEYEDNALIIGGLCGGLIILNVAVILDLLIGSPKRARAWEEKRVLRLDYECEYYNSPKLSDFFCSLMLRIDPQKCPYNHCYALYSKLSIQQIINGLNLAVTAEEQAGRETWPGQSLRTTILNWHITKFAPHVCGFFKFIIQLERDRNVIYSNLPITEVIRQDSFRTQCIQTPLLLKATIEHFANLMTDLELVEIGMHAKALATQTKEIFRQNYFKAVFDEGVTIHVARNCALVDSPAYSEMIKSFKVIRFTHVRATDFMQMLDGSRLTSTTMNLAHRLGLMSKLKDGLSSSVIIPAFNIQNLRINLFVAFASHSEMIAEHWFQKVFSLHCTAYRRDTPPIEASVAWCNHVGLPEVPGRIARKLMTEYDTDFHKRLEPRDLLYVHRFCKTAGLKTYLYNRYMRLYVGPGLCFDLKDYWIGLRHLLPNMCFNEKDDFLAYCKTPEGREKLKETYEHGLVVDLEEALAGFPD